MDCSSMKPYDVRRLIREEKITTPTAGMCAGYAQANLVILPKELAYDFLLFTQRNPKSCPLLEVSDEGCKKLKYLGNDIDITTDIPKYRVYEKGILTGEYTDVDDMWRDDFVSFLIGCSFSFESDLIEADVPIRHIEENCNVPMFITNIDCTPAGMFNGKMVVSMRPLPYNQIVKSVLISGEMPKVHGAPVHIGEPSVIGIKDITKPDFGDAVTIKEDEVPVFWACGVTPQSVVMNVKPEIVITHSPGHMLITDIKNIDLKY
ncbi:MAG: putative hydro-lyase [Clostridium sp.]|uniref:putative hydro-lyase n=1 Tax=Clostridium sp. TaxID=1506 RepID=UPI0025C29A1C|nr:putative hydro-lyase [Clostridium sp.]MCH3963514.1 putative hydro-lyase [Clostridium sp.]MCI1714655.1 putative hydro-lyase [Clostridium sp.]MCI1799156.1 putative hydro-lyase [Clostridium sp.]MCI1812838.1 putative hydro-lyase [Clostridium sp.]MCI1869728.1 putative hydro-lyase [Clostridium sp.]